MRKVLIVDADARTPACLRMSIPWEQIGCTVAGIAKTGEDGLVLARQVEVDIVICDVTLPDMSGMELCCLLRDEVPGVKLLFVSDKQDFQAARFAIRHGVCEYVLKPLVPERAVEIAEALARIVAQQNATEIYDRFCYDSQQDEYLMKLMERGDQAELDAMFAPLMAPGIIDTLSVQEVRGIAYHLIRLFDISQGGRKAAEQEERQQEVARWKRTVSKCEMLDYVKSLFAKRISLECTAREQYSKARMREVVEYLDEHFMDPKISLSLIAERFSYSPDYLGRLFGQFHSVSISEYLVDKRFERATLLLSTTSQSVTQIIQSVGYLSHGFFYREFGRRYHITPGEYRSRNSKLLQK